MNIKRASVFIGFIFFLIIRLPVHAAVVINEFQIEPSGASQWIELFNNGPDKQDISGWIIDDDSGTEKFPIPSGTMIASNICISFQSGNLNWNTTSSDSARLISGTSVVDEYTFSGSPGDGVSFGRSPDGSGEFTTFSSPTRDKLNSNGSSCIAVPTATTSPTATATQSPTSAPTSAPTNTPTITPTSQKLVSKTPTPTKKISPTPTPIEEVSSTPQSEVLGLVVEETATHVASPSGFSFFQPIIISLLFVASGLALLAFVFIIKKKKAGIVDT